MSDTVGEHGDNNINKSVKRMRKKKNKKNGENELRLCDKIIELLRSEGFAVTPPDVQRSEEEKLSSDKKIAEALKAILIIPNGKDIDILRSADITKTEVCRSDNDAECRLSKSKKRKERAKKKSEAENTEKRTTKKKNKEKSVHLEGSEIKSNENIPGQKFKSQEKSKKDAKITFPKYMRKEEIRVFRDDPDSSCDKYAEGCMRINPKNSKHAYLTMDDGVDILIVGLRDRNRALDKDVVAVMIKPDAEWYTHENGDVQKTATVVKILEKVHSRKIVGTLVPHGDNLKLRSRDCRVPTLIIHQEHLPEEVKELKEYGDTLFLARIDSWNSPYNCKGKIEAIMGNVGDLEAETTAILLTNGLDVTPYDDELIEGLPSNDYVLVASDLENREDFREECVFTIDPSTAVDLDDAVSCKILPNGNYEVGVHISDVTNYLSAFSPLDKKISERATTVYLVNAVYHMLPKSLCQLCSLLPGQDKLTFSVVWEMTPKAEVIKHRFAKSVIKSCYQMAYEEAQQMIEESTREWRNDELPGLTGNYTANDLRETVNNLYKLSTQMRQKRFANGALSINQPKLQIILDRETQIPISYRIEERQESNKLIEEFMLLANMTVAKHLYETMPDIAFLRIHGEPLKRVIERTSSDLGFLGVHLNTESPATLQSSLSLYEKTGLDGDDEKFATNCRMMVINALCAQSMPRANYTCSGMIPEVDGLRHFALNVPFYTHFTSPIRRYADCVVHRLLFASMTNTSLPSTWTADLCAKIASNCNGKKYSAKIAQEKSNELYFMDLLSRKGPTDTMAIVMKVNQRTMDVILCLVGITISLNYSDFEKNADVDYNKEHSVATVNVRWKTSGVLQVINVFSMINLRIEKHPKFYAIRGILLPSRLNETTS